MQRFTKEATMRKFLVVAASLFIIGCGGSNDTKQSQEETSANAGAIKVTKNAVIIKKDSNNSSKENSGQFYYSYNKKNDKEDGIYNSETSKVRTTLDAYLNIKSPYERVRITLMIKRLSKDYIIKCSPCHDDYANGVIGPSLLDKDGNFIYGMLQDFKTGKKKNALMRDLVNKIDDAKLKAIADEIANFNKEIRKMRAGK
jgi:cytochrome c553